MDRYPVAELVLITERVINNHTSEFVVIYGKKRHIVCLIEHSSQSLQHTIKGTIGQFICKKIKTSSYHGIEVPIYRQ